MELDRFTFVLLRRGPRADEYSDEELAELQRGHLAFLDSSREQGHLVLAGPFDGQEDETKRGFSLFRTDVAETKRLMPRATPRCVPDGCPWR